MERRSKKKKVLLLILFLLACLLIAWVLKIVFTEPKAEWDDSLSQSSLGQITYEGKQYSYNDNLTNILFWELITVLGFKMIICRVMRDRPIVLCF